MEKLLVLALLLALLLTGVAVGVPFISALFGFTEISLLEFAVALGLAATVIPAAELRKLVSSRFRRRAAGA